MNTLVILSLVSLTLGSVTNQHSCTCSELTAQSDCQTAIEACTWNPNNGNISCQLTDCASYQSQSPCDESYCAWKGSTCAVFSGTCSDYTTTTAGGCSKKSSKCTEGTLTNGTYTCKSSAVTCSALQSAEACTNNLYQEDGKMCYYSGSTCAAYDVSKCSTRPIKEICNSGCMWVNDACVAETCASITDLTQCTSVFNDNFSEITICAVSGQNCIDAVDAKALTSSSCYKNTIGYFFWDGSVCSPCTGNYEISKSNVLALFGTVVLLFI